MLARLIRGTPFRIALVLSFTLLAALGIAGAIAQFLVRDELSRRLDGNLSDTFTIISQSYGDGDLADLEASVMSHIGTAAHGDQVFRLADQQRHLLTGNIPQAATIAGGWSLVSGQYLGQPDKETYRVFSGRVGGNELVVGASTDGVDEVWRLVVTALAWSALAFVLLLLTSGGLLAVRAQRRLDGIAATMTAIGQGNLAVRLPVGRRGDDIDRISTSVNSALDRLAALVESMRQVSVDIAHDLKTPLSRLSITVENAIEAAAGNEPVRGFLDQVMSEAAEINSTFEALLRIAQIEAGARRSRFAPVRIDQVISTVVEIYEDLAREGRQSLQWSSTPIGTVVTGDRELLTQLVANLVANALRHTPAETRVIVAVGMDNGRIFLTVEDNGPGIPVEEHARVFRRLYRMDHSRNGPGSGLGLSLAKAVADLHEATIRLEDAEPGLRVRLVFPPEGGS